MTGLIRAVIGAVALLGEVQASPPVPRSEPAQQRVPDAQPAPERALEARPAGPSVTRADLAAAYLRLEKALAEFPPGGERLAEVNRAFDRAMLSFFAGQAADAVRKLNELSASLAPQPLSAAAQVAASLKVRIEPNVYVIGQSCSPVARIEQMYDLPDEARGDFDIHLRIRAPDGRVAVDRAVQIAITTPGRAGVTVALEGESPRFAPGRYDLELAAGDERVGPVARWSVVSRSLDEVRQANEVRLAEVKPEAPALQQALAVRKARNKLLADQTSENDSAQFLADPARLSAQLTDEIDALVAGKDPYLRRPGDYWRVLQVGSLEIALRVFAPPAAVRDAPVPLLIALHGAGGDENMFFDAYGCGIVKRLAEEQGLLVVAPATALFAANPVYFDKLLEALAFDYAIDPQRVYVLGHSLGAAAAAGLARKRSDKIAAVCCLAGAGHKLGDCKTAPTLVIAAELDALIPATRAAQFAERAANSDAPIEFRTLPNYGHTLMVGAALPDAIDWLVKHTLATPAADAP